MCSANTDASGAASCTIAAVDQTAGAVTLSANFAGDTYYLGSSATSSVTVAAAIATTSLTTTLAGGGQQGASIAVPTSTPVTDSATLAGSAAADATGTVSYRVFPTPPAPPRSAPVRPRPSRRPARCPMPSR